MGSMFSIYKNTEQAKLEDMKDDYDEFHDAVDDELNKSDDMSLNNPKYDHQEHLVTDAVESKYAHSHILSSNITFESVSEIEKNLKYYEKVSLVFLLYDHEDKALQSLLIEQANINQGMSINLLSEWAKSKHTTSWQNRFVEALCVVQNYAALRRLGFDKEEMKITYLPSQPYACLHLNRVMKALYCLCEQLTGHETKRLIKCLETEFHELNLRFNDYGDYLELYLLHCFSMKYIRQNDLSKLINLLKRLLRFQQADMLESVTNRNTTNPVQKLTEKRITDEAKCNFDLTKPTENYANPNKPVCSQNSVIGDNSIVKNVISGSIYDFDPNKAGICLIINQRMFHKDERKEKKIDNKKCLEIDDMKYLEEPRHDLEERQGTDVDRDSLSSLFKKLGFKVVVQENLIQENIIPTIQQNMKQFSRKDSCFIVCILSHGIENKIYAANSLPVSIDEIKDALHDREYHALLGKPKILIIQSCQGTEIQKVYRPPPQDDNETDGPKKGDAEFNLINDKSGVPEKRDLLVCMSTVPGFASVRNRTTGSWYIQEICKTIEENYEQEHFLDMMTMVTKEVSSKRWEKANEGIVTMVPQNISTLDKKLYLRKVIN